MKIKISKIEYSLGENTATKADLLENNSLWPVDEIELKTGIQTRHLANQNQTSLELGYIAADKLLKINNINPTSIDALIFITQTPSYLLPGNASILQNQLNLSISTYAFDVNLGCSGFIYGLSIASSVIESKLVKNALIVCADTYTKIISKSDRTCSPIFSDGAAAILIERSSYDDVYGFSFGTDGSGYNNLIVENLRFKKIEDKSTYLYMDGAKVLLFTLSKVPELVQNILLKTKLQIDDIDWFIFHQASKIVLDSLIQKINIPKEKVFSNIEHIGNTVSASIPIALKDASAKNFFQKKSKAMILGFGVGYSWGGCIIEINGYL